MKRIEMLLTILLIVIFTITNVVLAQDKEPRKSPSASVSQKIGLETTITFNFSRPSVKGRTIWGELVPWGFEPGNKYSDNKPFPWRGGANENTTIEFTTDVKIQGQSVKAGKYGLHFKTSKDEWTVFLNSVNDKWGSYQYDPSKNVASFASASVQAPHEEWLIYGFEDYKGNSVIAYLHWEKLKLPFTISVDK